MHLVFFQSMYMYVVLVLAKELFKDGCPPPLDTSWAGMEPGHYQQTPAWGYTCGKLHFLPILFSAFVVFAGFTPFSMEITQPGLPGWQWCINFMHCICVKRNIVVRIFCQNMFLWILIDFLDRKRMGVYITNSATSPILHNEFHLNLALPRCWEPPGHYLCTPEPQGMKYRYFIKVKAK